MLGFILQYFALGNMRNRGFRRNFYFTTFSSNFKLGKKSNLIITERGYTEVFRQVDQSVAALLDSRSDIMMADGCQTMMAVRP